MMISSRRWAFAVGATVVLAVGTPSIPSAYALSPGTSPATSAPTPSAAIDFNGIVKLSNCSGSLVRWTSSKTSDTALMLTNGHCTSDALGARDVVVDEPIERSVTLLATDGTTAGTVITTRIVYATMWKTDVALYELDSTYKQIESKYDVSPITLADAKPAPDDQAISIISGYWKTEYDCHLNGFAWKLHEAEYDWFRSLRYTEDEGCQLIGGTSGSPVLDRHRVQIGIHNTHNSSGDRCTINNPCEENRKGKISVHEGRGYGEETWVFYTCLSHNTLDLDRAGCKLAKP